MPMESVPDDVNRELMLDGNAVAGELREMFSVEVTTGEGECAACGKTHAMGALLAFTHGPGIVLRCPSCEAVMLKLVRTPRGVYLDAHGIAVMRIGSRA
jgi:hypothetical protein